MIIKTSALDLSYFLNTIPFIETAEDYQPDKEAVDKCFKKLAKTSSYRNDYNELKEALLALHLSKEEVSEWLLSHRPIPKYEAWKKQRDNYFLNKCYTARLDGHDPIDLLQTGKQAANKKIDQRTVLNKHNAFAEVAIENQTFCYPDESGYQTLSFETNHHFTRKELNSSVVYGLVPGFKVTKNNQKQNAATLVADDTVSTKLPEAKNSQHLIYL